MRRVNGFAAACGRVMSMSAGLPTLSLPPLRPVVCLQRVLAAGRVLATCVCNECLQRVFAAGRVLATCVCNVCLQRVFAAGRVFATCVCNVCLQRVLATCVCTHLHMLQTSCISLYPPGFRDDEASFDCSSALLAGAVLQEAASTSQMLTAVISSCTGVSAVRYLSALTRGPLAVTISDWVLLREGAQALVANVSAMVLVSIGSRVVVRMWCRRCQPAGSEDERGMIRLRKGQHKSKFVLVDFEHVAVMALSCNESAEHLDFRYIF